VVRRPRVNNDESGHGRPWGLAIARAVVLDTAALLPVALAGALGVLIVGDLHAPAAAGGVMVGAFFLAGAVFLARWGAVIDSMGWWRSAVTGQTITACSLVGAALARGSWIVLVIVLGLAGVGSSITQPASSVLLNTAVPAGRRGFAMSVKFAAVPAALLMAGLAVPALGQTLGWRLSFLIATVFPLGGLTILRSSRNLGHVGLMPPRSAGGVWRALLVPGVSMFLASMLPGVLLAFTVPAMLEAGIATGVAGLCFAGCNLIAVASRLAVAGLADRPVLDGYRSIGLMILVGALGTALVSHQVAWSVLVGCALAFGLGWGWTGHAFFLAVRSHPENPGAAASVIQSGGMFGSAAGPLIGALAVQLWGLAAAWLVIAACSAAAAAMLLRWPPADPEAFGPRSPLPEGTMP
jgi:MFS family permease